MSEYLNDLQRLAAIGMVCTQQRGGEDVLKDAAKGLLSSLHKWFGFSSPPPDAATLGYARMACMRLFASTPDDEAIGRVGMALLSACACDGDGLLDALSRMPAHEQAVVLSPIEDLIRRGSEPVPAQIRRALLKMGKVYSALFVASPSRGMDSTLSVLSVLAGEDQRSLLSLLEQRSGRLPSLPGDQSVVQMVEEMMRGRDASYQSVFRCVVNLMIGARKNLSSPADALSVLRLSRSTPGVKQELVLKSIAFLIAEAQLLHRAAEDVRNKRMQAEDALELLEFVYPFFDRDQSMSHLLSVLSDALAGTALVERVKAYAYLKDNRNPSREVLLKLRDMGGGIAQAALAIMVAHGYIDQDGVDDAARALTKPYRRIAFSPAFDRATTRLELDIALELSPYIDLNAALLVLGDSWGGLSPASRGVLLGKVLVNGGGNFEEQLKRVNLALEGLTPSEVDVLCESLTERLRDELASKPSSYFEKGMHNESLRRLPEAMDLLNSLAAQLGAMKRAYLPYSATYFTPDLMDASRVWGAYIRSGLSYHGYKKKAHLSQALKPLSAQDGKLLGALLTLYVPEPRIEERIRWLADVVLQMPSKTRVAFMESISPLWRLALAAASSGKALNGLSSAVITETANALPLHRRRAFLSFVSSVSLSRIEANVALGDLFSDPVRCLPSRGASEAVIAVLDVLDGVPPRRAVPPELDELMSALSRAVSAVRRGAFQPIASSISPPGTRLNQRLDRALGR